SEYDDSISKLLKDGLNEESIIEELMVEDIQKACDIFRNVYDKQKGNDGFVSIEVAPTLAHKTQETINSAKRIWEKINRPNVMIEIPATLEGLPAITETIANGINVNVTLIFSIERYKEVVEAYIQGLKKRLELKKPVNNLSSVASVFVSRIDTLIDNELVKLINKGKPELTKLLGKSAVANTKLLYQEFKKIFYTDEFESLKNKGAKIQRPLWASTSTKNPNYSQTLYVDELIGQDTVNTIPPQTLIAFQENGRVELTIERDLDRAKSILNEITSAGINLNDVMQRLEDEGVLAFEKSFLNLRDSLRKKISSI
ncbi:MAG: transaldolase, partial [Ignavibacteria bacterium]|nr:transaldolase [Ignavibacteria bacterium]